MMIKIWLIPKNSLFSKTVNAIDVKAWINPSNVEIIIIESMIWPFRIGVFNNASNWPESCFIFFILKTATQKAKTPDDVTQIPGAAQFKYLISKKIIFDKGIDKNKWSNIGNKVKIKDSDRIFFLILSQSRYSKTLITTPSPHL